MSCSMNSKVRSSDRLATTSKISPLSSCGTPAAGSSSNSTLRLGGERQRDLQQPLAAIGQFARRLIAEIAEPELHQDVVSFLDRVALDRDVLPERAGDAPPLGHRQRHRFQRVEAGEQCVDLERARQAPPHPILWRQIRDVFGPQIDLAGIGRQHAGHQVDQRGLAGAVGPDQRVARAYRQAQFDIAGDHQRSEVLGEAARGKRRRIVGGRAQRGLQRPVIFDKPPRMPLGRKTTTNTSRMPIQKYQYCGAMPEN